VHKPCSAQLGHRRTRTTQSLAVDYYHALYKDDPTSRAQAAGMGRRKTRKAMHRYCRWIYAKRGKSQLILGVPSWYICWNNDNIIKPKQQQEQ